MRAPAREHEVHDGDDHDDHGGDAVPAARGVPRPLPAEVAVGQGHHPAGGRRRGEVVGPEDGPIAQTVREAVQEGVSYFTSSGNFAQVHVEQPYCSGPGALHDFDCGTGTVAVGMIVPPGGQVLCVLQWNDRFGGSVNDYDLLAVDTLGDLLAGSFNVQDGTQDPFELLAWANPLPFSVEVHVGIVLFSGAARLLDLFCPMPSEAPGSLLFVAPTPGGSIFGHAAVREVVAVAAVDVAMPGLATIEPYSSEGPVNIFFPAPESRPKPDVASFDDVSTTVPGFIPFRGT
jgi:hypothetical protein